MNLSHLNYFVRLADEKHFANAAKSLSIARSTLSLAVSQLEQELDAPLFNKNGSSFELTTYGQAFYRYASRALDDIDAGIRSVETLRKRDTNILRIGAPFAIQNEDWSRLIRSFRTEIDPDVSLDIHQNFSAVLLQDLAAGNLDVTFAAKLADAPEGLTFTPYWSQELTVAVNKDNPLAKRKSVSLDDLKGLLIHSYAEGRPPYSEIEELVEGTELNVNRAFKEEITICSMISADETAVAFVDYSFLVGVFNDVVCLPIEGVPRDFHKLYLVHRADEPMTEIQEQFIAYVNEHPIPAAHLPR